MKSARLILSMLVFASFAFLSLASASAQDAPVALLEMLTHVPDTAVSRGEIYFSDFRAIETAYPPARMPANWAAFEQLSQDNQNQPEMMPLAIWWKVFFRGSASALTRNFLQYDKMPDAIGIDFFSINRELDYGTPPNQTLQLEGSFDLDSVRAALTAQGYEQDQNPGGELWCSTNGCQSGADMDLTARNPANPFGGELGRHQPILIAADRLISTATASIITDHVAAAEGNTANLGDAPEYKAAVNILSQNGTILQAYFLDGDPLAQLGQLDFMMPANVPPAQARRVLQGMLEDYETLPTFKLAAFADTVTDTEQAARVVLVYDDAADAKTAADLIPKRLAAYQSLAIRRLWTDLLKDRRVEKVDAQVVKDAVTGKDVVLLTLATPKATTDQILAMTTTSLDQPDVTPPGLVYRLLLDAVTRRDLGWLSTVPREDIEKFVNG